MLLGGAAVAGLAGAANAALVIDVRAVSATGSTVVQNAKTVRAGGVGDVITFNVFAVVTGANGDQADDGILSFAGSFLSGDAGLGAVRGSLSAARSAAMLGSGGSNGLVQDLDGDGDLDVGSNNNSNAANFFSARSKDAPTPQFGMETLSGTLTMTIGQLIAGGSNDLTNVNFRPRTSSTSGSWFEDGSQITSSAYSAGANVQILGNVPEPMSLGVAGLVGLGLLRRRNRA